MQEREWVTLNVDKDTRTKLKIISAETGRPIYDLLRDHVDQIFKEHKKTKKKK